MASGAGQHRIEHRTVVFTDIAGSTAIIEAIGDELWFDLITGHHRAAAELCERFGGDAVISTGDGVCAVFKDAEGARSFAVEMLRLVRLGEILGGRATSLRIGMASGSVYRSGRDYFGRTMHLAARLNRLAHEGQVMLDERCAGELVLSGVAVDRGDDLDLRGFAGLTMTYVLPSAEEAHAGQPVHEGVVSCRADRAAGTA